jgi:hypothetical protein
MPYLTDYLADFDTPIEALYFLIKLAALLLKLVKPPSFDAKVLGK